MNLSREPVLSSSPDTRGDPGSVGSVAAPTEGGRPRANIAIGPMRRRHLRGVVAIEQETNHRPWSLGLFMGELRMPTSRSYVVAFDMHRVLGFSGLMFTGTEGHVTNIAVHQEARRLGIATRLMTRTMRDAISLGVTEMTLEVRASNSAAQELYRTFGFAPEGVRRNYYAEINEDALIMWAHSIDGPDYLRRLTDLERGEESLSHLGEAHV